jgi:hypothetical protein
MFSQSTQHKVDRARELFAQHRQPIARDEHLQQLLTAYRRAIGQNGDLMNHLGVAKACGACAREPAGSCCSDSVEDWYDPLLLLLNLLMGCELGETRANPADCGFVGPRGCNLVARHYYCVHHLCPSLHRMLGPAASERLLAVTGVELFAGWQVEQGLTLWLQRHS